MKKLVTTGLVAAQCSLRTLMVIIIAGALPVGTELCDVMPSVQPTR